MKKLLCLLLVLLMLLPCVLACQKGDEPGTESTAGTTGEAETEDPFADNVPEFDFKEREFRFMAPSPTGSSHYDREETTSDAINDAIYSRNRQLEMRFNITISAQNYGWTTTQANEFAPFATSGEDVIDVIGLGHTESGIPMITGGYILPWNGTPYINLDKQWWNKSVTDTLAILGNYYCLSGDITWNSLNYSAVFYFNKEVAEDYKALVGDLYENVRNGDWTQEALMNYTKAITRDNGDSVWDEKDTYGYLQNSWTIDSFTAGSDYMTVYMTDDGVRMNINTEKMAHIVDYAYELLCANHLSYMSDQYAGVLNPIFFDNRALFMNGIMDVAFGWRAQETDFGILPVPKYNKEQKDYTTYSDQWGLVLALPCTASDPARTGAILEAMAALSRKLVIPAYYEKSLLGKVKRDNESEEMLDIIYANIRYDFGRAFATTNDFLPLRSIILQHSRDLSSWYKAYRSRMEKNYNQLYDYVSKEVGKE